LKELETESLAAEQKVHEARSRKNVLLEEVIDGERHAMLTDFGLSKQGVFGMVGTKSFCGSSAYLAPEILDKKGHGKAVDWYSLGALMYEMLTGLPPFYTRDRDKLFERIRRGELAYPSYITVLTKHLLQSLLAGDAAQRLGAGERDGEEVKEHHFFAGIDWIAIQQRRVTPPFKPNVSASGDVKYFEKEFVDLPVVNSEVHEEKLLRDVNHFEGFTYQQSSELEQRASAPDLVPK